MKNVNFISIKDSSKNSKKDTNLGSLSLKLQTPVSTAEVTLSRFLIPLWILKLP